MSTKIGIIGVNEGVEKYEKEVIDFLTLELKKYDIEIINFTTYFLNTDEERDNLLKESKFILLDDATVGINPPFTKAVKKLYKNEVLPLVLVTHIESEKANPEKAYFDVAEVAQYVDPTIDVLLPNYDAVYFNYDNKIAYESFYDLDNHNRRGIEVLVDALKTR